MIMPDENTMVVERGDVLKVQVPSGKVFEIEVTNDTASITFEANRETFVLFSEDMDTRGLWEMNSPEALKNDLSEVK